MKRTVLKARWFSVLLACFTLLMLCACACAEEVTIVASGYCGSEYVDGINGGNLTYQLDSNGKLTISGQGEMAWFYSSNPWSSHKSNIVSVEIMDGVTDIGDYAFQNCSSLTSVSIPESVTKIGSHSFEGCSALAGISVPKGVTNIGSYAFQNCSSLASIQLPGTVTKSDFYAFKGCTSLTSVHVTAIEDWLNISFDTSDGNPLCNGGKLYVGGELLTELVIPEGITAIKNSAFRDCTTLTSVVVPDTVTQIGTFAFSGCENINRVYVDSLESWLAIEFKYCSSSPLYNGAELYVNGNLLTNVAIPEGTTELGCSLAGCTSLTSVTLPQGMTSIGENAFYGCENLTSISIPDSVTSIGAYAFWNCNNLTSLVIPDQITMIEEGTFSSCGQLKTVRLPDGLISIGEGAFSSCSSLSHIELPGSITSIEAKAFYNCSGLISVTIHDGVSGIASNAFSWCYGIRYLIFPGEEKPTFSPTIFPYLTTICCYEYTPVDFWASSTKYKVQYLDDVSTETPILLKLKCGIENITYGTDLAIKESKQLEAIVYPIASPVQWSSSDPQVASVENGLITGRSAGTATITVTCGTQTASVEVTVYQPVESFGLLSEVWLVAKEQTQIAVFDIQPENAKKGFSARSADTQICSVSENRNIFTITGKAPGQTTVTIYEVYSGIAKECIVHVCYPVTSISFENETLQVFAGTSVQLSANVVARNETLVNKLVTFASSDESVAKVDSFGTVKFLTPGTATITATASNGVSGSCTMEVTELHLPEGNGSLTEVSESAFSGGNFRMIALPDGCKVIRSKAFENCHSLEWIYIPDSVYLIAEDAFDGCENFVIICEPFSSAAFYAQRKEIPFYTRLPE